MLLKAKFPFSIEHFSDTQRLLRGMGLKFIPASQLLPKQLRNGYWWNFLNLDILLCPRAQVGFQELHLMEEAINIFLWKIRQLLDKSAYIGAVFLDLKRVWIWKVMQFCFSLINSEQETIWLISHLTIRISVFMFSPLITYMVIGDPARLDSCAYTLWLTYKCKSCSWDCLHYFKANKLQFTNDLKKHVIYQTLARKQVQKLASPYLQASPSRDTLKHLKIIKMNLSNFKFVML